MIAGVCRRAFRAERLDHVCVVVRCVPTSIMWYGNVLGLRHVAKDLRHFYPTDPEAPAFLQTEFGDGVALLPLAKDRRMINDHLGAHFALNVPEEETFLSLRDGGLHELLKEHCTGSSHSCEVDYQDYGIQQSLFFNDPDANIVELAYWRKPPTSALIGM